jgi:hypothetical protein
MTPAQVRKKLKRVGWSPDMIAGFLRYRDQPPPADLGPLEPLKRYDYSELARAVLAEAVGIAERMLKEPEPVVKPGVINFANSGRHLVYWGLDDLRVGMPRLSRALAELDERKREAVYNALFYVLRGLSNICGYGIVPISAMTAIDDAQGAIMRKNKHRSLDPRDDVIRKAVAAGVTSTKEINNLLRAADHPELSRSQMYRKKKNVPSLKE